MGLSLPDSSTPTVLEELIQQSVFRFETKLHGLGILAIARAAGFVDEYRKELEGIADAATQQIQNEFLGHD